MGWRSSLWFLVAFFLATSSASFAQPKPVADSVVKAQGMAMEHYDLGDYSSARQKLNEILTGLSRDKHAVSISAAKTHVLLGVVHYKESHADQAVTQYVRALKISTKVTLPKAYRDEGNQALFAKATRIAIPPKATCDTLPGVTHTRVTGAKQGVALTIESRVGNAINAHVVVVMFRIDGKGPFVESAMNKIRQCTYSGDIAGAHVKGQSLSYYVVARNKRGKPIARHASPGNPIVVAIAQTIKRETVDTGGKPGDDEVPGALRPKTKRRGCGGCDGGGSGTGALALVVLFAAIGLRRRRWS